MEEEEDSVRDWENTHKEWKKVASREPRKSWVTRRCLDAKLYPGQ